MGVPTGRRDFGPLTPAALNDLVFGLMVEAVIMAQNLTPAETKPLIKYSPSKPQGEVYTLGDRKLQRFIVRRLRRYLNGVGIIAEEPKGDLPDLRIKSKMKNGRRLSFTVDPLDGSKMLIFGIRKFLGIMISLVEEDDSGYLNILGGWIANVYTGEIFSAPVGSTKTFRTYKGKTRVMVPKDLGPWADARVIVNCDPVDCPDLIRPLVSEVAAGGKIGRLTLHGGSGGLMMVEGLVGGEADAIVIDPFSETPWDLAPSRVFLARGGYVLLRVVTDLQVLGDLVMQTNTRITANIVPVNTFGIWTHGTKVPGLRRLLHA